ncbi:MAG TPA: hypothetical protein VND40_05670 [Nitrososphaerales archaeon]|nr:hypothetical protein [Nitrososphaerales archaeon]
MKSARELVVPIMFLAEGVFWLAVVATGGAGLLTFAALAFIVSGLLLALRPDNPATRPLAGASALFGLTLAVYQVYEASTLYGTSLSMVGLTSGAVFGVFAVISAYLELEALSMGNQPEAPSPKKP